MQTNDQARCQHVVEEVCGVGVVVGVSTWTLSSWIGPPNGFVKKIPWNDTTINLVRYDSDGNGKVNGGAGAVMGWPVEQTTCPVSA